MLRTAPPCESRHFRSVPPAFRLFAQKLLIRSFAAVPKTVRDNTACIARRARAREPVCFRGGSSWGSARAGVRQSHVSAQDGLDGSSHGRAQRVGPQPRPPYIGSLPGGIDRWVHFDDDLDEAGVFGHGARQGQGQQPLQGSGVCSRRVVLQGRAPPLAGNGFEGDGQSTVHLEAVAADDVIIAGRAPPTDATASARR